MTNTDTPPPAASAPRSLAGGFLMGLANLVPGISGGTMILAIGLYDTFIDSVAKVTRFKLEFASLRFLALLAVGVALALLSLSGVAVGLVNEHRWVMYSLFIGLTLGGVPTLWKLSRPVGPAVIVAFLLGLGLMVALAFGLSRVQLPDSVPVLALVGAFAASSMILPGVSGSYVLLIFGMYDLVIGSLSASVILDDFGAAARIIVPVGVGAVLGVGLLSNLLKALLARFSAPSHAALLGLLVGAVVGLWPFQEPVHADLAQKPIRKATAMVLAGSDSDAVRERYGADLDDARLHELGVRYAGKSPADLKAMGDELQRFTPTGKQISIALGLLAVGIALTRSLGGHSAPETE